MNDQNVIILDVETSPLEARVWDLKDQNIGLNQIIKDSYIIAWAAKKLGDPASKVIYRDLRNEKDKTNDKKIMADLWKILNDADIVITQNGKAFDGPKINARFIMHGFRPPLPYKHLDTYLIAKTAAKFTSNKLEYLTEKLNKKYKKLSHGKFPGMKLWDECLAGNIEAWNEMKRYNINDVLATEELYTILAPWAPKSAPVIHKCKNPRYKVEGVRVNTTGSYVRSYCVQCGRLFKKPLTLP